MSRRTLTLVVAAALVLILGTAAALLPVPYVILSPGPTINTLGSLDGKRLISIKGHPTYPEKGHLNLVTVSYRGGPGSHLDLFSALRAWIDPHDAVVPQQALFPADETVKQVNQENVQAMATSQETATAAALNALHISYTTNVVVAQTEPGKPAAAKLKADDIITAVDGKKVTSPTKAASLIGDRKPGDGIKLTITRDGEQQTVRLTTAKGRGGKAMIGVVVGSKFVFPFKVSVRVGNIGGPSAGMMFALGIIDKLTPGSLTGGHFVAGTGEISPDGKVGEIGGIQQKMVAARAAGATVFLTPKGNCASALSAKPNGLRLVKVHTLQDSLNALKMIRTGRGTLPSCG